MKQVYFNKGLYNSPKLQQECHSCSTRDTEESSGMSNTDCYGFCNGD